MTSTPIKIATTCALILAAAASPAAADHEKMAITTFHSLATVNATVVPVATCKGSDGVTYNVLAVNGSGPITSDDPRMVGIFTADALILDSPVTGYGVSVDSYTITDATTGDVKVTGFALATDLGANPRAITFATLGDGSHMVANTLVTLPAPGSTDPLTIEYGGAGLDQPDRGVIVAGNDECTKMLFAHLKFGN